MIKFSELKRNEIRSVVFTDNKGNAQLVRGNSEIDLVLSKSKSPIKIYNANNEQAIEIAKYIVELIKEGKNEVNGTDIILKFIPMLTNIELDLNPDNEEDLKKINDIIENPSDEFDVVSGEIGNIINYYVVKVTQQLLNTQNEFDKIIKQLNDLDENDTLSDEERIIVLENIVKSLNVEEYKEPVIQE